MKFLELRTRFVQSFVSLAIFSLAVSGDAQNLYVGANYHPHDSNPETWTRDIQLMQQAGIRVVRMGHLAWDSYEPKDGH